MCVRQSWEDIHMHIYIYTCIPHATRVAVCVEKKAVTINLNKLLTNVNKHKFSCAAKQSRPKRKSVDNVNWNPERSDWTDWTRQTTGNRNARCHSMHCVNQKCTKWQAGATKRGGARRQNQAVNYKLKRSTQKWAKLKLTTWYPREEEREAQLLIQTIILRCLTTKYPRNKWNRKIVVYFWSSLIALDFSRFYRA